MKNDRLWQWGRLIIPAFPANALTVLWQCSASDEMGFKILLNLIHYLILHVWPRWPRVPLGDLQTPQGDYYKNTPCEHIMTIILVSCPWNIKYQAELTRYEGIITNYSCMPLAWGWCLIDAVEVKLKLPHPVVRHFFYGYAGMMQ